MNVWLGSLKARLLLILVGSLLLLQLLSYGVVGATRGYAARHLANEQTAQDLQWLPQHLLPMDDAARAGQLDKLRRGGYRLALWADGQAIEPEPPGDLHALREAVASQLGDGIQVAAGASQGHPVLLLPLDRGQRLAVLFDQPLPSSRPSLLQVLGYTGVITLLVALVSIWAVNAVTRPLKRLTAAGGQLARNIATSAPMEERGPMEVRTLATGFNTMQRAVLAQLRERTFILGAISHDLKTPLTRLKLRLSDLPADAPREAIDADLDAMAALIDEGLDYARSTQLREACMPVDLVALLEGMVDDASDLGQPVQLAVAMPVTVSAAPRALTRLLQNLIDNAVRYGGNAQVSVHASADEVHVQVADDGPGIAPERRERMFEPFVRGEASRGRDTGGTGLGLAIARVSAAARGGRVWLGAGAQGKGLVAHVVLPRHFRPQ